MCEGVYALQVCVYSDEVHCVFATNIKLTSQHTQLQVGSTKPRQDNAGRQCIGYLATTDYTALPTKHLFSMKPTFRTHDVMSSLRIASWF